MFRIGEFSKLAQVPASQLRYYDEVGLFRPAVVEPETGYRYYKVEQFESLNQIIALKELGFSLKQIRHQLEDGLSVLELRSMLELKKAQAELSLEREMMRLSAIEARIVTLDNDQEPVPTVTRSIPRQHYWGIRDTYKDPCDAIAITHKLGVLSKEIFGDEGAQLTVLLHDTEFQMENMDLEIGLASPKFVDKMASRSGGLNLCYRELPALPHALTAIRRGGFEQGAGCYEAIGKTLAQSQGKIIFPGREVFLVPPSPDKAPSDIVCEIQLGMVSTGIPSEGPLLQSKLF